MSVEQISPASVSANPANVNPQAKTEQSGASVQATQNAQKAIHSLKTDTVTISKQAVQQLASDGDTPAVEVKESTAEKDTEKLKGRK